MVLSIKLLNYHSGIWRVCISVTEESEYDGSFYTLNHRLLPWDEAAAACVGYDKRLVSIKSSDEQVAVEQKIIGELE